MPNRPFYSNRDAFEALAHLRSQQKTDVFLTEPESCKGKSEIQILTELLKELFTRDSERVT